MRMKYDLKDKYVVVSGASGGIGGETEAVLAGEYGAKIIGIGRNEEKLKNIKTKIGDAFEYEIFDVSVRENWTGFAEKLGNRGIYPVLLVNNAGMFPRFEKTCNVSSEEFAHIMEVNFMSAVYAVEALLPLLNQNPDPGIYNVCSSAALCAVAGTAAYSASKSALKAYTESLMLENNSKLYVGAAYPGVTMTDLFRGDERVKASGAEKIASSPAKTAYKIVKAIISRKKRKVIGWDAAAMSFIARLLPWTGPRIIAGIMKKSGAEVFSGLF